MILTLRSAALPDERSGTVVAVFPPDTEADDIFAAVLNADGRLVNATWFDSAWLVHSDQTGFVGRLREQGAWAAFRPALFQPLTLGGCFLVVAIEP